jgi:hypothetical protein
MRILNSLVFSLICFSPVVFSQDFESDTIQKHKHDYQVILRTLSIKFLLTYHPERCRTSPQDSDQQSLLTQVSICSPDVYATNNYYREIFLRELISNANDALEKFRLTALTDKDVADNGDPLNITIKAVKDEDGGRIIISGAHVNEGSQARCNISARCRHWHWNVGRRSFVESGTFFSFQNAVFLLPYSWNRELWQSPVHLNSWPRQRVKRMLLPMETSSVLSVLGFIAVSWLPTKYTLLRPLQRARKIPTPSNMCSVPQQMIVPSKSSLIQEGTPWDTEPKSPWFSKRMP